MDRKFDIIGELKFPALTISGVDEAIFEGLKKFTNWIGTTIFVCWILIMAFLAMTGRFDKDDTDPQDGRSGMKVYTDNKTGCQYLGTESGGMTPRLNEAGHHICEDID